MRRILIIVATLPMCMCMLVVVSAQLSFAQKVNETAGVRIKNGACMGAAIPAKKDGSLKFAVMSDVHISIGAPSVEGTAACVEDINKNPDIQFVIISGDIANFGADDELACAKNIFDKLNKPWFIVAGNHDATWSESGTNSFAKAFGYERFSFDAGGIKFLGTQCGPNVRMAPALIPRESMLWLDSCINALPDNQPFVFVNHYPLDSSLLKYDEVLNLLKKKNIQFSINGHWHTDNAMDYEGIPGAIVRSTLATKKGDIGYVIVNVEGATVTFSDKVVGKDERNPWFTLRMSNGAPYNKEIKYEHPLNTMNSRYPQIKELWRVENSADIGCAAAIWRPGEAMVQPNAGANALPSVSNKIKKGDIAIYADEAGYIYGLNAVTGSKLWSYKTEGKIFSSPAVANLSGGKTVSGKEEGIVVIGSTDNYIYALKAKTGKLIWKFKCRKSVLGTANIYNGRVYIGASDGSMRALNLKNGKLIWENNEVKGFMEARPYVDNEQVVMGDWATNLYSFNPKNGKTQWIWSTKKSSMMLSPAEVWPVKSEGKIIFVTPERINYQIDAKTGELFAKSYGGRESIGLSPDGKYYFIKNMKDTVRAYKAGEMFISNSQMQRAKTGIPVKWQTITDYGYEIAPTPVTCSVGNGKNNEGIAFIPTDKGNIYALNIADGSIAWERHVAGALINYILPIGQNQLLISTMDGIVTVLEY